MSGAAGAVGSAGGVGIRSAPDPEPAGGQPEHPRTHDPERGRGAGGGIAPERARTDAHRVRELDRLVRKLAAADAFSGVVLFAKDGHPLYFEAFGVANRDYGIPVTRETRFNPGDTTTTRSGPTAAYRTTLQQPDLTGGHFTPNPDRLAFLHT